jgi:hypothetical protein
VPSEHSAYRAKRLGKTAGSPRGSYQDGGREGEKCNRREAARTTAGARPLRPRRWLSPWRVKRVLPKKQYPLRWRVRDGSDGIIALAAARPPTAHPPLTRTCEDVAAAAAGRRRHRASLERIDFCSAPGRPTAQRADRPRAAPQRYPEGCRARAGPSAACGQFSTTPLGHPRPPRRRSHGVGMADPPTRSRPCSSFTTGAPDWPTSSRRASRPRSSNWAASQRPPRRVERSLTGCAGMCALRGSPGQRQPPLSLRSLAVAWAAVCHCMFAGVSVPPQASGTM